MKILEKLIIAILYIVGLFWIILSIYLNYTYEINYIIGSLIGSLGLLSIFISESISIETFKQTVTINILWYILYWLRLPINYRVNLLRFETKILNSIKSN